MTLLGAFCFIILFNFYLAMKDLYSSVLESMLLEVLRTAPSATFVDFNSSALHEPVVAIKIKNNPDPMKICCEAMRDAFAPEAGDKILEEQGSGLTIRYVLPRPGIPASSASSPNHRI